MGSHVVYEEEATMTPSFREPRRGTVYVGFIPPRVREHRLLSP